MQVLLLAAAVVLLVCVLIAQIVILRARRGPDLAPLCARMESLERAAERTDRALRDELARGRDEAAARDRALREELTGSVAQLSTVICEQMSSLGHIQRTQLDLFGGRIAELSQTVDARLRAVQEESARQLEQMRRTVDEHLQSALEKRLSESFQLVSERLEQVYTGLGEMRALASGVGDLKKVLSGVRARGTWGEMQLGALLEQMLHPDQYDRNVATAGTSERVEFAIRLPGAVPDSCVWLPLDAKFPQEDYLRLVEAAEHGDAAAVEICSRQLESRIRACARDIRDKYIAPPLTTDFAIMYLPTESLYAEALRRPGLVETLQREYRVAVAGPTTLAALLNSLQMGFQTLAIQRRSSEVWDLLGAVKREFSKYSDVLARVQKKLQEAANTVDQGLIRTRAIEKTLRDVAELPAAAETAQLSLDDLGEASSAAGN
ncbi:MAG TPA: DNA recombination protein RmuC [Bryobacteraceae bacterium]|jgi:DNA recombination protein RmuC|nr:DNA recombination protein RmuC [Bryobacteraceae bacterium]